MSDANDMELLQDYLRNGSEPAFTELVQRHVNLVYSAAIRQVGIAAQAEEISQAVFVILAQKARTLRPNTVLAAWLYETTRLTAISFLRGERRRQFREQEAYMQSTLQESTSDPAWEQMAPLLDEALSRLGAKDRQAVLLRFFRSQSMREVARALETNEAAAQKRVGRAVEKLRGLFARRGVVVPAAVVVACLSANSVQAAPAALVHTIAGVAVTNAAAAGSSTLSLVKGALKLMAWAKVKTAMIAGTGLLLAAGTTAVITSNRPNGAAADNDPLWSDDSQTMAQALSDAPPMVLFRESRFPTKETKGLLDPVTGKMVFRRISEEQIFTYAYNEGPTRILFKDAPKKGFYDFLASIPEKQREAFQHEIRKQLGFEGHRELRETKVYLLKPVGDKGPNLKEFPSDGTQDFGNDHYIGDLEGMDYALEGYLKTPVINQSNWRNGQVTLRWQDDSKEPFPSKHPNFDGLNAALREQLGLELIATNQPLETLVVERVKR